MIKSEDDVRTKVVIPWLIEKGFNLQQISVEYSFSIRLGRSTFKAESGFLNNEGKNALDIRGAHKTYYPRADVLVRDDSGNNLLVIEVKSPQEKLNDMVRDQAISYARLLIDGNIAPFSVITNGLETKVFDSITKLEVTNFGVSSLTPFIQNGFRISTNELHYRTEAIQALISFSSENLIAFCEAQTNFRMKLLKSEDIFSGKKYIPSLYVEREDACKKLNEFLDDSKSRVVILIGPPQVGKTNFICHFVEERIRKGYPCLFYPAIGLIKGLLNEISDDFEWGIGNTNCSSAYVHRKLKNVLSRSEKNLTIFIDGWNETNLELARVIDLESERIACEEIQLVISLTHVAANRLLGGTGGNPSRIAEAANITSKAAQLLEISPEINSENFNWNIVPVKQYSDEEREHAYRVYSNAYNVEVPNSHGKVSDPYSLGTAMRLFQGNCLPDNLDEPSLLNEIIKSKIERAIGLDRLNKKASLCALAKKMVTQGAPLDIDIVSTVWGLPICEKIPDGFFDSALLAQVSNIYNQPAIDFYYGKERDFIIAYWACNWNFKLLNSMQNLSLELENSIGSNAGKDAVRWFFNQVKHLDLIISNGITPNFENKELMRLLLASILNNAYIYLKEPEKWIDFARDLVISYEDNLVKIESIKLLVLLTEDRDDITSAFSDDISLIDFLTAILSVSEEFPFHEVSAGFVVLEAIRDLHWSFLDGDDDSYNETEVTETLIQLMDHDSYVIRLGAASCLGFSSPFIFLKLLGRILKNEAIKFNDAKIKEYDLGLKHVASQLSEGYYGAMCPGALEGLKEDYETLQFEFEMVQQFSSNVITQLPSHPTSHFLVDLLESLNPVNNGYSVKENHYIELTLPIPFEDLEKE